MPNLDGKPNLLERHQAKYIGKTFGKLTIINVIYEPKFSYNHRYKAMCKCACGSNIISSPSLRSLKSGKTKTCGCAQGAKLLSREKLLAEHKGKKYGLLTILDIYPDFTKTPSDRWQVQCACDCDPENKIEARFYHVVQGQKKSCGCLKKGPKSNIEFKKVRDGVWQLEILVGGDFSERPEYMPLGTVTLSGQAKFFQTGDCLAMLDTSTVRKIGEFMTKIEKENQNEKTDDDN